MRGAQFDKSIEKVAYLMDHIPKARENYLFLILAYWEVFDGIDIPDFVIQDILRKGTPPETINRSRRRVMEQARLKEYLDLQRMAKDKAEDEAPLK